jgi:glutathione reductase (NADPH)
LQVGDETLVGRHVVIATGARHAPLGIPGQVYLTTSAGFLELDELLRRGVFVGSGYIALECTHVTARAGAHPLERFDADLFGQLVQVARDLGVDVQVNATVEAIERRGEKLVVHTRSGDEMREVAADLVVHAAGRVPEIDDLDLAAAGIACVEKGGVAVNEYLQSVSPASWPPAATESTTMRLLLRAPGG